MPLMMRNDHQSTDITGESLGALSYANYQLGLVKASGKRNRYTDRDTKGGHCFVRFDRLKTTKAISAIFC